MVHFIVVGDPRPGFSFKIFIEVFNSFHLVKKAKLLGNLISKLIIFAYDGYIRSPTGRSRINEGEIIRAILFFKLGIRLRISFKTVSLVFFLFEECFKLSVIIPS